MDLRGKKLLVIGGAGFIGSHTVDALLREDVALVRVYDNFSRGAEANLAAAARDPRYELYPLGGDILHRDLLGDAMRGMDGVFHFAALWLLHCHDFPRAAFDVNVGGTFNVLEACVREGVQRLVYSSSASVYGDAVSDRMVEDHPFHNRNFYGATKIAGEAMARAMHHRYGLSYAGLRYMNVYGPRQDGGGPHAPVILKMLAAIESGQAPVIHGQGDQAYDFVAVEDCARANVLAMSAAADDRFYNVGTGVATSLKELAKLLLALTGSSLRPVFHPAPPTLQASRRVGDPALARRDLGFEAAIGLEEGLHRYIASPRAAAAARH